MPRAPWRRRRTTDSPRPAGRHWAGRLRRSGTIARHVLLVRVGRRQRADLAGPGVTTLALAPPHVTEVDPRTAAEITAIATPPAVPGLVDPVAPAAGAPVTVPLLPGDRTVLRQVQFALVNACTLASLMLGVIAIMLAMRGEVQLAALCLIACVLFDGMDGALARWFGVSSPFGAQMDSLADMCSFGIAAPVVVYASLSGSVSPAVGGIACALVAACAAIRLARFNVSPHDGRFFVGVPTTMAAAVLALAVLIELPLSAGAQLVGVALLAFAMVSSFPYAKLARLVRLPAWLWLVPLAGALINAQVTFALIVSAYLVSGPLLWLHQRRVAEPGRVAA